jgi:type IV pilus assembly protein PilX
MIRSLKKQHGIVLFFSLIVLVLMTIIGVALAVNSTQSLRMAGAGTDRLAAMSQANGALDLVISQSIVKQFATATVFSNSTELTGTQVIRALPISDPGIEVNCQRSEKATAANLVNCRRLEISSSATFGRSGLGQLTVTSGIEQEVLAGS